MVNYTFIDTGPPVQHKRQKPRGKPLPHDTQTRKSRGRPPGYEEQSPPSFFEKGSKARWFILLLPFWYISHRYKEISPFQLPPEQFLEFYFLFFISSAFTTHLALKAKRRTLTNLLHEDPTAYYLEKIRLAYIKPGNTILVPLICIACGTTKTLQELYTGHWPWPEMITTLSATLFFILLHKANSFTKYTSTHSGSLPFQNEPQFFSNLKTRNYE